MDTFSDLKRRVVAALVTVVVMLRVVRASNPFLATRSGTDAYAVVQASTLSHSCRHRCSKYVTLEAPEARQYDGGGDDSRLVDWEAGAVRHCQCDPVCETRGDCCVDFQQFCDEVAVDTWTRKKKRTCGSHQLNESFMTCLGRWKWDEEKSICRCETAFPLFGFSPQYTKSGRQLERHVFRNCYPGQRKDKLVYLRIGIFVDAGFYKKAGGSDEDVTMAVNKMVLFANDIYEDQLSISLRVDELAMAKPGHTIDGWGNNAWMDSVPNDSNGGRCDEPNPRRYILAATRLIAFTHWVHSYRRHQYGAFLLLTACYMIRDRLHLLHPVYGLAHKRRLCSEKRTAIIRWQQKTKSVQYITFAHELGHVLGARHPFTLSRAPRLKKATSQGLMDYYTYTWNNHIQFHSVHLEEMCPLISSSRACTHAPCFPLYRLRPAANCWATTGLLTPKRGDTGPHNRVLPHRWW